MSAQLTTGMGSDQSNSINNTAANALKIEAPTGRKSVIKRLISAYRNTPRKFKVGLLIIVFFVLLSVIGPFVRPYNPNSNLTNPNIVNNSPSFSHWLGTDYQGNDVLSEVLVGTGPTLLLGLITGLISTTVAIVIGVLAGYYGGIFDHILSLFTNVFLMIPALPPV